MAKTKVPGGYIADGSIAVAHLHSSHGITTDNIAQGSSNKYYTDAQVDTRLAASKSTNITTTGNLLISSDYMIDPRVVELLSAQNNRYNCQDYNCQNNLENKKRGLNRKFSNDRSLQLQINKQKVELLFTQTNKYIQKEILSLYNRIDILNSEVKHYRKDLIDNGIIKKSNINLF